MDDFEAREVSIEVVYVDEHLIELAVTVNTGHWRGRCTAWTSQSHARPEFAEQ